MIDIIQSEGARTGEPVLLLIFDTAVSLLRDGGGDENSQRDVCKLTDAIDKIRGATGGAAILVHHSKRGEQRAKGSEVLEAWAETIANVSTVERSNTTEPGLKARFALQPIDLGEDDETGAPSQVVMAVPSVEKEITGHRVEQRTETKKLGKDVDAAYSALKRLPSPLLQDDWRSDLMSVFSEKSGGARRQAISHARQTLQDEGLITIDGDYVSVIDANF